MFETDTDSTVVTVLVKVTARKAPSGLSLVDTDSCTEVEVEALVGVMAPPWPSDMPASPFGVRTSGVRV